MRIIGVIAGLLIAALSFGRAIRTARNRPRRQSSPEKASAFSVLPRAAIRYAREHAGESAADFGKGNRREFRAAVARALEEGWAVTRLRNLFREQFKFSPERALDVAQRELSIARARGNLVDAVERGVKEKRWASAEDNQTCPFCEANQSIGWIGLAAKFPAGEDCPPALSCACCRCDLDFR